MKPGQPSYTAEVVACYRAVESLKPEARRVCHDPYAHYFLRRSYRLLAGIPPLARFIFWLATARGYSGDAAQGIARTRYIDDYVQSAVAEGARQVILLGAGYDTRSYRLTNIKEHATAFELDNPDTQIVKKARIEQIFGQLPPHVVYIPIDFNAENLAHKLAQHGYDAKLRSVFIWEGVTFFLTAQAVDDTLGFVRNHSAAGSSIIFDYTFKSVVDGTYPSEEARKELSIMERLGEPYTFGIEEGTIAEFLTARGFREVTEVSPELMTRMYFNTPGERRKVAPFLPLAHAQVAPHE